jgi:hypothetical protein
LDPRRGANVLEAGDAVDSTAFSNITNVLISTTMMDAYQAPAFWASAAVRTIPTRFNGEKIAGIEQMGDKAQVVNEGMPYPNFGFGEDYIETPTTTKRGFIVPVTKEAIFFDQTNLIATRAGEVGEWMGVEKEKRVLDMVLGCASTFATGGKYKWKGTEYDVYQSTQWDNTATNTLTDYTDIDEVELLFAAMTDPATGEPIIINPAGMTLVVMPDNRHKARSIMNATEIKHGADTGAVQTISGNTLNRYTLQDATELAKARLTAAGKTNPAKYWYLGDFGKAFAYMENWPLTVVQAPANNEAEFTQDIVMRFKASERGVCAVMNPRFVVQSTGAS